jgi:hypothetical protein
VTGVQTCALPIYVTDKHLSKVESNSLAQNTCPYCSYAPICLSKSISGTEKICLFKSTETHRVWARITKDRPKVQVGKTYGKTTVISFSHVGERRGLYWNCIRDGKEVQVRGDLLLRLDEGVKADRIYRRGSSVNPDGTLHKYPMEHHSKVGCALEKTVTNVVINDDGDHIKHRYETRVFCTCGSAMRYDEYGDSICENCTGLARRVPKPCLDPEIRIHEPIDWMGVLEVRSISSDTSSRIEKHEPTKAEIDEDCEEYVADFKVWCQTF